MLDAALSTSTVTAVLAVLAIVAAIVIDIVSHGAGLISWRFLTEAPTDAGRSGGIWPVLKATAMAMAVCMSVVLPIGLVAAVGISGLTRHDGRPAVVAFLSLDVLAGTPSVVFGLFGHAFFCGVLGMKVSVLVGGLTLACMTMPLFVRLAELALREVAPASRTAINATGLSRTTAVVHVLIPAAAPRLCAAAALALARGLAETAALLFTSGYVLREPVSLGDPGRVLSVHVYDLAMNVAGGDPHAYASALVLLVVLLVVGAIPVVVRGFVHPGGGDV